MQNFLESIGIIIIQILNLLGNVATSLLSNEIFQILVAIIIFTLLINLIINLVKNINEGKQWEKKYSKDAINIEEEEYNDYLDSIM